MSTGTASVRATARTVRLPRPGDVLLLDRRASVQFMHPIWVRVVAVLPWSTYTGWRWLRVYQLDPHGAAAAVRDVFVQPAGLRYLPVGHPLVRPAPAAFQQRAGRTPVPAGRWSR